MATPNRLLVTVRAANLDSDSTLSSAELDLGPYANAGKRQIIGVWAPGSRSAATDTDGTFDNKFQESATTVSGDFSDISGAAFTQVAADGTPAFQTITFSTNKRYIRSVVTLGGTAAKVADFTGVLLVPRFDT